MLLFLDPGWVTIRIRDKHPRSATLFVAIAAQGNIKTNGNASPPRKLITPKKKKKLAVNLGGLRTEQCLGTRIRIQSGQENKEIDGGSL